MCLIWAVSTQRQYLVRPINQVYRVGPIDRCVLQLGPIQSANLFVSSAGEKWVEVVRYLLLFFLHGAKEMTRDFTKFLCLHLSAVTTIVGGTFDFSM